MLFSRMRKTVGRHLHELGLKWMLFIVFLMVAQYNFAQTKTEVLAELERQGVKHPKIVLAQSLLETGHYKCKGCSMDNNNLFGFFYKGEYLKFNDWQLSVAYYDWWQNELYKGGDYYTFLERVGYATDPEYINKLKSIVKTL